MKNSIPFVKPKEDAINYLESILEENDFIITNKEILNKGQAIKFYLIKDNEEQKIILYFNNKSKQSSKIVFEKLNQDNIQIIMDKLEYKNEFDMDSHEKIPIHASINIEKKEDRNKLKQMLNSMQLKITENKVNEYKEYMYRIEENNKSLMITQFNSGKLLIQGSYSSLVKKIVDQIEIIKPLTETERLLFFVPEANKNSFEKTFQKEGITSLNLDIQAKNEIGEIYDFLYDNDKKTYKTGISLIEIIKKYNEVIPEYNFIIAPFANVFEGFILKILINKNFFTEEAYKKNPNIADIGNCLRKRKLKKYLKNPEKDENILKDLELVWSDIRCKELHTDALEDEMIVSVNTLQKALDRIGRIRDVMVRAYNCIIKYGYTDDEIKKNENFVNESHIGTDESGKGDYFGPLVVAGVFINKDISDKLISIGVKDSKELSDMQILEIAKKIKEIVGEKNFNIVIINPEKYNQLYEKMKNLNLILGWAHSRAIENILTNSDCKYAIADQFGDEKYIKNALLKKGKSINLIQRPKAENDIAVAAASILAREVFLIKLSSLSKEYNINLPKGSSDIVIQQAKNFVNKIGREKLHLVAKLHFKTTKAVLE